MRNRLTKRYASKNLKAESQADGLFPGDVGNMERSKNYHDIDEYHTFEQTVNHELPDMRHEWKDNPRTETGHGIPKMASMFMAAKKATKLAMMLLGEDATDEQITAQAKDFMRMGNKALTASVNRWAEVVNTETEQEEVSASDETVEAEDGVAEAPVACDENKEACNEEVAPVASEEEVAEPAQPAEVTEATEDIPVAEDTADTGVEVGDEGEEQVEDVAVDETEEAPEVEFDEADEEEETVGEDPELVGLFDDEVEEVESPAVASKKAGIKRLAGQPKLVRIAKKDADELSGLWSKWEKPTLR